MTIIDFISKYKFYLIIIILLTINGWQYVNKPDDLSQRVKDELARTEEHIKKTKVLDSLLSVSEYERDLLKSENYDLINRSQVIEADRKDILNTLTKLRNQRLEFKINYKAKDVTDEELDIILRDAISKFKY